MDSGDVVLDDEKVMGDIYAGHICKHDITRAQNPVERGIILIRHGCSIPLLQSKSSPSRRCHPVMPITDINPSLQQKSYLA